VLTLRETSFFNLIVDFDCGRIVGADSVTADEAECFLTLKEFGSLQVWSPDKGYLTARLNLNEPVFFGLIS
jgi:hypothetical protein